MPFCLECGKENPDQARFCQFCGQAFPEATPPPPPPGSGPQHAGPTSPPGSGPQYAGPASPPGNGPQYGGPPASPGGQYHQRPGQPYSTPYGPGSRQQTFAGQVKSPVVGGILGFINFGLGAFYNRQNAKGVVLLIITILFGGATWAINPLLALILGGVFAYDGYKISQRINNGETVGPWQFF